MANDEQPTENGAVPSNRIRLSEKVKKLSNGIRMFMYGDYTEDKGGKVESGEAIAGGEVIGRYVKKDGQTVETSASSDAQQSGEHVKMAQAAGVKKEDIRATTATAIGHELADDKTGLGRGPEELGATSKKQADTPSKPEETVKADLHEKTPAQKNPKGGGKPDASLFKPKGDKDPGAEGDFSAEKSKPLVAAPAQSGSPKGGKPDKSMSSMANMKNGPTESMEKSHYDAILADPTHPKHAEAKAFYEKALGGSTRHMAIAMMSAPRFAKQWFAAKDQKAAASDAGLTAQKDAQKPELHKAVEIKSEPGKITYKQTAPGVQPKTNLKDAPIWKKRWDQKPKEEKQAFSQHLTQQRMVHGKAPGIVDKPPTALKPTQPMQPPKLQKDDGDKTKSARMSLEELRARLNQPKQSKPGTRDEKIKVALSEQGKSGSPYATTRDEATHAAPATSKIGGLLSTLKAAGHKVDATGESAPAEKTKPILLKDMARYKKFTASGRPFRVMMGTHDDHRSMVGQHHELQKPMSIKEVDAALKNPTSEISRKVLDSVDSGHDTLLIHQPKNDAPQVGHLKVMKSIQDRMDKLQKNVVAGYGQANQTGVPVADSTMLKTGWQPTPHPSDPKIMNKNDHMQNALKFAQRTSAWIAGRGQRMAQAKASAAESTLDQHADRHMQKAAVKPGQEPAAPQAPAKPGVPPSHSPKIRAVADAYAQTKGIKLNHNLPKAEVNADRAGKIAQAYHAMPHTPHDPNTKQAYHALINETADQFKHMAASGLKVSPIKPGSANPYQTSKDMLNDVHTNNHLWYYPTDQGFGSGEQGSDHPMLQTVQTHQGPMVANDVFRIVHDYFGHAKEGNGFGPKGEEGAWQHHMQMYSPAAQQALTSETRGQNSWVNFGPHAEHNRQNPHKTIYADQKAGLLPEWALK